MLDAQTLSGPSMEVGVAGPEPKVTASVCADELPHPLLATTVTLPVLVPTVAFMALVVELPVQVFGNVQVYDVAPFTGVIEKVSTPPEQAVPVCKIFPGVAGAAAIVVTVTVCADELPHALFAVTEIVPPVEPAVVTIVSVVEVPVQPLGKVQV